MATMSKQFTYRGYCKSKSAQIQYAGKSQNWDKCAECTSKAKPYMSLTIYAIQLHFYLCSPKSQKNHLQILATSDFKRL